MHKSIPLAALLLSTAALAQSPADDPDNKLTPCLVRELQRAAPTDTVAELRARCAPKKTLEALQEVKRAAVAASPTQAASAEPDIAPELLEIVSKDRKDLSLVQRRAVSEINAINEPFALLSHRPNYLLPVSWHERPDAGPAADARQELETQFQISFKFPLTQPLFGARVLPFFGYTGRAWWQVYDGDRSRPFREYNHEPEVFAVVPTSLVEFAGWKHRLTVAGFAHHSNGRSGVTSRSWNRVYVEALFDRGQRHWASAKVWHRLPESNKTDPAAPTGDDNPDITRFMGHGELKYGLLSSSGHNYTLTARKSFKRDGKGALQFDWSLPTRHSPSLRWYVQAFAGYGDSLIDYNQRVHRIGFGLMLNDWFQR